MTEYEIQQIREHEFWRGFQEGEASIRGILQLLYDCQNGCPLPKYQADWDQAMEQAQKVLGLKSKVGEMI